MPETLTGPAAVDAYLATIPDPMGTLARQAAAKLRQVIPGAHETREGLDVGFGTAPGYRGLVFSITPQADHVTLGFSNGATLSDPTGLLEGSGRTHKHVKLRTKADLDRASLDRLLKEAAKRRTKR